MEVSEQDLVTNTKSKVHCQHLANFVSFDALSCFSVSLSCHCLSFLYVGIINRQLLTLVETLEHPYPFFHLLPPYYLHCRRCFCLTPYCRRSSLSSNTTIGHLTGETKEPNPKDSAYANWDAENSMVMTWLINSMTEDISCNYICYSMAKELWDNVSQLYSDLGNQSQVYELTLKFGDLRQGDDNVTKYFNSLKQLWQDLDLFNDYEWKSIEDANYYKKTVKAQRIYKFLAGLNVEFDEVRGRIIGRSPLPPISEVFTKV
ncbi:hypothetical protein ACOSQ2_027300 [Xanthoceras sorbifolium]